MGLGGVFFHPKNYCNFKVRARYVRSSRHNHGWRCTSELATRADVATFLCSHLTVTNEKLICDGLLFIAAAGSWQYENNYTSASSSETNNLILQTWPIILNFKNKKNVFRCLVRRWYRALALIIRTAARNACVSSVSCHFSVGNAHHIHLRFNVPRSNGIVYLSQR